MAPPEDPKGKPPSPAKVGEPLPGAQTAPPRVPAPPGAPGSTLPQARPSLGAPAPSVPAKKASTSPSIPSAAPPIPSVAPNIPSVAPNIPSVAPNIPSVAPNIPSVAPNIPSVAPSIPSVAPGIPSVAPNIPSVAPSIPSVAPNIPSVKLSSSVPVVAPASPKATETSAEILGLATGHTNRSPVSPHSSGGSSTLKEQANPLVAGAGIDSATTGGGMVQTRPTPLPHTGAVDSVSPEVAHQLARIAQGLAIQDYFEVLQIPQSASSVEVRRSFYRESRIYHPDRVFHLDDETIKANIGTIYKRITEAYYVLRDDAKRQKYLIEINSPERQSKLRFTETSESEQKAEAKKAVEEEFGLTPKGRQFFKTALQEMERNQWAAAERSLKSAMMYEPANARFKEKLGLVQTKIEEQRKRSGDTFKIK